MRPAWQLARSTQQQQQQPQQQRPVQSHPPPPQPPPPATARSSFDDEFGDGSDLADNADMFDAVVTGKPTQPQQQNMHTTNMQAQPPPQQQQLQQPPPSFPQPFQPPLQQQQQPPAVPAQPMMQQQLFQPQQPQQLQPPFQPQPVQPMAHQPPMQQPYAPQPHALQHQFAPQQPPQPQQHPPPAVQQQQQFHASMQQPQQAQQPQPPPQHAPQYAPQFAPPQLPPQQPSTFHQTIQRPSSAPRQLPFGQQLQPPPQQQPLFQPQMHAPPPMPPQLPPPQTHPPMQPPPMQPQQIHTSPMHAQMQPQQPMQPPQPPPQAAAQFPPQPQHAAASHAPRFSAPPAAPAPFATANTFVNNAAAPQTIPVASVAAPVASLPPSRVASPAPAPDPALSAELAALRAALAAKDEELAKKSGEVSVLRQRQEQAAREQLAKTIQLSQSNNAKPFPSSQSHFPSSQHTRHADSAQQQQITRMSQQVSAMQAQKESSDQQAAEAAAENARLKRSMEQMQRAHQQREQQLQQEQQQRAHGGSGASVAHAGSKRPHPESPAPRLAAAGMPNGLPPAAAAPRPVAPPHVPSPPPAAAAASAVSPASATAAAPSTQQVASSWRSPFGAASADARWSTPSLLRPSHVLRAHVPLKPLEGLLAQLQQIQSSIAPIAPTAPPPASSRQRRAQSSLPTVKLEVQDQKRQSSAAAAPSINESQMIHRLCEHVRLSLDAVLHSPSIPLSTLLSPLRQTLLFCCSTSHGRFDGFAGAGAVKVEKTEKMERVVKLEPPAILDLVEEKKHSGAAAVPESLAAASSIGEKKSMKRQLVRLLLHLLYFCASNDADEESSSVQIGRELMGLPSSSAEQPPSVQPDPPAAAVLPHLNHNSWSWAPVANASPPAADAAMSDVSSPSSAPVAQLADAMSWSTLLKRLLHDSLTIDRSNSMIELLMGTIQSALANGLPKPASSSAVQLRSARAAEDKLLQAWLPRLTHVLLALNGSATNRSRNATPPVSPSPQVQAVYASIAQLLVRWCQWWPARIASVLQPATSVVVTSASYSAAQSSALGTHCSCNVLELLFLWAHRLGSGFTFGTSNAPAVATIGTFHRSDWMILSLQLLSAQHRCWTEHKNAPSSPSPSVCPVHAAECGLLPPLPDSALLPTVFALFSLPFAQFRVLCSAFQQAVESMLANAQRRMQIAQPTQPSGAPSAKLQSCIAAHASIVQYLHDSLRLLLSVLQPRRRSWRDLHAQLAAVDADVLATLNARELQPPPPPHARNNRNGPNGDPEDSNGDASATTAEAPSTLMLVHAVREACDQIGAFAALERTSAAQQQQQQQNVAWTSTVAMAAELSGWFVS